MSNYKSTYRYAIIPNRSNNTVIKPDQMKDTNDLDFSNRKLIHSSEKK